MSKTENKSQTKVWLLSLCLLLLTVGLAQLVSKQRHKTALRNLNDSEQRLLERNTSLQSLSKDLQNLHFPDPQSSSSALFQKQLKFNSVLSQTKAQALLKDSSLTASQWTVQSELTEAPLQESAPWKAFLETVDYFEHCSLQAIRTQVDTNSEFAASIKVQGLGYNKAGEWFGFRAQVTATWTPTEQGAWRISTWRTHSLETIMSPSILFEEILDRTLPEPDLSWALECAPDTQVRRYLQSLRSGKKKVSYPPFGGVTLGSHPSVTVVDIDQDGWDDLYVTRRLGKNSLYKNLGNGRLRDVAEDYNLDLEGPCNAAAFADFDNDGDQDLVLGRTDRPALYLENKEGLFQPVEELVLPYFVTSISVVDYNLDGLLDFYLCTYAPHRPSHFGFEHRMNGLDKDEQDKLLGLLALPGGTRGAIGRYTVPNRLFRNLGQGKFERDGQLELFRASYQAAWADYDQDGDPDVYIASDFSPNYLFQNDDGRFTDITDKTQTADNGLGMGASWGDYDQDGKLDLYTTNMYSKAGARITEQLDFIDPKITKSTRGNTLFRQTDKLFEHVSGLHNPDLLVENGGFSWAGQFLDLNNDSRLDIHCLSGYYSAPEEFANPVDS